MASSEIIARLALCELRVRALELEARLRRLRERGNAGALGGLSAEVRRVVADLRRRGVAFSLRRVSSDYYAQPLEWRRERLGAARREQLCKTLLLEDRTSDGADDASRYVAVVVQYA